MTPGHSRLPSKFGKLASSPNRTQSGKMGIPVSYQTVAMDAVVVQLQGVGLKQEEMNQELLVIEEVRCWSLP